MTVKVYVGAGHGRSTSGGYDPGAQAGGLVEEQWNERVCTAVATALRRQAGVEVKADTSAEQYNYQQAVAAANAWHADYAMEIHHNIASGGGSLALVTDPVTESTKAAAVRIVGRLSAALGTRNLGVISRSREAFNRDTRMPSCIPEVACLDGDAAKIKAPGYATRAGEAIARGVCDHFRIDWRPPLVTVAGTLPVLEAGMVDPVGGMWMVTRLQLMLELPKTGTYDAATIAKVASYNSRMLKRTTDGRQVDAAFWKRLYGIK